ncbi:hypothetical protein ACIP4S_28505 [Streptomyces chartreusis]
MCERVWPVFDRSFRLVFGVMTALASSLSVTERITMVALVRSMTVLA